MPQIASAPYLDPKMPIGFWRKNLPHWEQAGKIHFVTFRLNDSMPQELVRQYKEMKNLFYKMHPLPWTNEISEEYHKIVSDSVERYIDAGYGSCVLKDAEVRQILISAIEHFDNERYLQLAYVIMPNHVHMLVIPFAGHELDASMSSIMRYSAYRINKLIGRKGRLWQEEPFDTVIRNHNHYVNSLNYIKHNPSHLPVGTYDFGGYEFRS